MDNQHKIAVLIDAENISWKYAKLILDEISKYGIATYKRVYGDFSNSSVSLWKDIIGEYAMTPIFQFNYTTGKNSSDSAIVIDAMDILYSKNVDSFCLVTSDSDFTKLAIRLREAGMLVIGMGEIKTPKSLVAACEEFKYLDLLYKKNVNESVVNISQVTEVVGTNGVSAPSEQLPEEKISLKQVNVPIITPYKEQITWNDITNHIPDQSVIAQEIHSIVMEGSDEDGWMNLADVGNMLKKRIPGFDPRNYGYAKLRPFIDSIQDYEVKAIPNPKNVSLKIVLIKLRK